MNTQLSAIAGKLNAYRLSAALSQKPTQIIKEVYKGIFQADFYKSIWDEPVLLVLQEFVDRDPPNQEVYSAELAFIKNRTAQVVAINDLFAAFLFLTREDLTTVGARIPDQPKASQALALLQANGCLDKIRRSSSQPREKLAAFVDELRKQVPSISEMLTSCFDALCARQELGTVKCLLITQPHRTGVVLPVRTMLQPGSGEVKTVVTTQETFLSAVVRARGALQSRGWLGTDQDIIFSADQTDATYSGSSITVGAAMAMYSSGRKWQFDPYTAFTGDIDIRDNQWRILRVEGIPEKLSAARHAGIRRVVLPRQNQTDVPPDCTGLQLVLVDDIKELLSNLTLSQDAAPADTVQQRKIALMHAHCSAQGWQVSAARSIQNGLQFAITPAIDDELTISIYNTGAHTPKQHQKSQFNKLLALLNGCDAPDTPLQSVQKTFNIKNTELREQIKRQFEALRPSEIRTEQYCDYSFTYENGKEKLVVKQYTSGKLQLQGYAGPLYRHALEIIIPQYNLHFPTATLNIADYLSSAKQEVNTKPKEAAPEVAIALPHIGTDESGKGDYFGPLVIAGVWVDESLQNSLAQLGVRDSKELSDRRCQELASAIREICPGKYQVVIEISPEKYNQLHEQLLREKRNLNHLLAWGHARAIESLLTRQECKQAIADQFGDEKYITSKLMEKSRAINLLQTPKAERFIAVAAASILARDHFLNRLSQLSKEAGFNLPKGASPEAITTARQIIQKHGADVLRKYAKLHFKTTASVLAKQ